MEEVPFFEVTGPPPEPPTSPPPPWTKPPALVLPGLLPMNQILAVGEKGVVALILIRAFDTGCLLEVEVGLKGLTTRAERLDAFGGVRAQTLQPGDDLPAGLLRFGVQLTDGAKATTLENHPPRFEDGPEPNPPVLRISGGRGHAGTGEWMDMSYPLWLWPLPPAQPFELVVEWPIAGIELTRVALDGAAIVAAAGQAESFVDRPGPV